MHNIDVRTKQVFRGEVLKELDKYQGDFVKINVIKKSFSPTEGLPMSKFKSVLNYLNDKGYIEWNKKDLTNTDDDLLRITARGQDIVDGLESDLGIII
ncbi:MULTISPECIES: hypothetical protein [Vallitalea]|uniref:Uncharacterized protein n=1 Tax=Vallitalea maricola TaxID=3074433 RepID=A0ACB5UEA4_9FIRM|nr:hypothetical protein [Vallitalea guaymasensis]GMQ61187.1 hypothetical protein AN2V17_04150 [Vallitalea sp. AN17-2]